VPRSWAHGQLSAPGRGGGAPPTVLAWPGSVRRSPMQSVCICGSFRFYEEMVQLRNTLQAQGVRCEWPLPGPRRAPQTMTAGAARDAIIQHLERIDRAECIVVFNKGGYLGN